MRLWLLLLRLDDELVDLYSNIILVYACSCTYRYGGRWSPPPPPPPPPPHQSESDIKRPTTHSGTLAQRYANLTLGQGIAGRTKYHFVFVSLIRTNPCTPYYWVAFETTNNVPKLRMEQTQTIMGCCSICVYSRGESKGCGSLLVELLACIDHVL